MDERQGKTWISNMTDSISIVICQMAGPKGSSIDDRAIKENDNSFNDYKTGPYAQKM